MDGWIYFDYWLGKQSLSCYLPHAKNGKGEKKKKDCIGNESVGPVTDLRLSSYTSMTF